MMMVEMKGKLETSYQWTCDACLTRNYRLDDKHCFECGKEAGDEKVLRHFRLTPEPMRLGWRT